MGFEVREGGPDDVPGIAAVYFRSWRAAYVGSLGPSRASELAGQRQEAFEWSKGIDDPRAQVLVGVGSDGRIAGVVQADESLEPPRDLPEITMLYVDPPAWGTGLATRLMEAALDWLATRGHEEARTRVVDDHSRARAFYEREGWTRDLRIAPVRTDLAQLISYRRSTRR